MIQLIGGLAVLGAGVALMLLHQEQTGTVLIVAGAAELGAKGLLMR